MTKSTSTFVLVVEGKPTPYTNAATGIKMFLHHIDKSPNAYEYKGSANSDLLEAELNESGKIVFYGFSDYSAPTAIALYKTEEVYIEDNWYNMAAKENPKNLAIIQSIESGLSAINAIHEKNKVLAIGDYIELADGRIGRIDVLNNNTMQVDFDESDGSVFPISSKGSVGMPSGVLGELFVRPVSFRLMAAERKMGTYWMQGAGSCSQGNKRLDLYAKTNVWRIDTLEAA